MLMKKFAHSSIALFTLFMLLTRCTEEKVGMDNSPNLRTLSAEEQELVQTSNTFTFDLFKTVNEAEGDQNVFISPLSVDIALHMTVNGATGETKEVMKQTLGVEHLTDEEVNTAARDLTNLLLQMDKKVALSTANSIWYDNQLNLQSGFSQLIENYYSGKIAGLNFDDPATKDIINGWVEDKTKGKIKDLIESVDDASVMFLVNAIYFKADWMYQFEKSQTKEDQFTMENGNQVPVQMMFSKGVKLRYHANETLQLLEIPYGNGQFNMVMLLPNHQYTTQDVINALTAQDLKNWIDQADTLTPQLYMPKFTMKFKIDNMKDVLSKMGMGLPFTDEAEFNGFFQESVGKNLAINKVIHQSFIEVHEEGSEAAAATAVEIVNRTSIGGGSTMTIRIDHPFVFLICEKHSEAVLFAGKMMNPTQED